MHVCYNIYIIIQSCTHALGHVIIDTLDYITRIINMRAIRVAVKSVKIDKNSLKWPKMMHFSNVFGNISGTQSHTNFKVRYPSGDSLLPATVATISSVCSYLKCFSPNNQTVSKWHRFGYFFDVLGPVKAAMFSKGSYPSGGPPQLGRKVRFLAATSEIQSQNVLCTGHNGRAYRSTVEHSD